MLIILTLSSFPLVLKLLKNYMAICIYFYSEPYVLSDISISEHKENPFFSVNYFVIKYISFTEFAFNGQIEINSVRGHDIFSGSEVTDRRYSGLH